MIYYIYIYIFNLFLLSFPYSSIIVFIDFLCSFHVVCIWCRQFDPAIAITCVKFDLGCHFGFT